MTADLDSKPTNSPAVVDLEDAVALAFPAYFWVVRVFLRWRLEEASRRSYRSRLVALLFAFFVIDAVWSLVNFIIYKNGANYEAARFQLGNGFTFAAAPFFGLYISAIMRRMFVALQPIMRSYMEEVHEKRLKNHKLWINLSLIFPLAGMLVTAAGIIINIIDQERYKWPLSILLNYIFNAIGLTIIGGALAPLAWTLFLFIVLASKQSIHHFEECVMMRDANLLKELNPNTPAHERRLLAVPPPPLKSQQKKEAQRVSYQNPMESTRRRDPTAIAVSTSSTDEPTVSDVIGIQMVPSMKLRSSPTPSRRASVVPEPSVLSRVGETPAAPSTVLVPSKLFLGSNVPSAQALEPSVDDVLRVQRALQRQVAGFSLFWQLPVFAAMLTAAFITAVAALNIISNNDIPFSLTLWMVIGPVILLVFLAPPVSLNTKWTELLRSPDVDYSLWDVPDRSWLTSRFALAPVTFPVLGISFDWPSLIKLLVTSLAPFVISQIQKLQARFQEAVTNPK